MDTLIKKQAQSEKPAYLNQKEAADLIRKKPRWLERMRCIGGGPPFRYIGRSPIYEKTELLEWVANFWTLDKYTGKNAKRLLFLRYN